MSDETGTLEPAEASPAADPTAGPEPEFRLLARDAVLRDYHRTNAGGSFLRGDIALVRGRLVARWFQGQGMAWKELTADEAAAAIGHRRDAKKPFDHDIAGGSTAVDPFTYIEALAAGLMERQQLAALPTVDLTTPADRELKRFIREWPIVSEMLGVLHAEPFRLFPTGRARAAATKARATALGSVDLAAYLQRHAVGDFGDFGEYPDGPPLAMAEVWALGLQPVGRQNTHAIATGRGWIRSRYPAGDAVRVEITTAIDGARAETLVTVG